MTARRWPALAVLLLCPALARADGGTLRVSRLCDGYRVTLFTAPADLRAGPVDFSVLVQSAESDALMPDVPVTVHAYPVAEPERRIGGPATVAAATNKLFRAIRLDLPEPGRWRVEVAVEAPGRPARVETELEVGPPPPPWIDLAVWAGWPAAAVLLFAVHQRLVRRGRGAAAHIRDTHP
jgi:hypothetical protein